MSQDQEAHALYNVNRQFISQGSLDLPVITLKDGTKLQTGTVGALLENIRKYDLVCGGEEVEGNTKESLEEAIALAVPTLKRIGMFNLFHPEEWMAGSSSGRRLVGIKALETGF